MSLTDAERKARRIGGSMIAKVLGKSKWGTPLDAYLELTGERPSADKTGEDVDRGVFLEPALREWASKKTGVQFKKAPPLVLDSWEWATVNPDGMAPPSLEQWRGGPLLEIKAPRRDDALQWGEEGSDEVPTDALLQTAWGMMIADASEGVIAALLGGELRIYRAVRDCDLEAKMLAAAKRFVEEHVLPRVPPPATYGDDKNVLFMHPRNTLPPRLWVDLSPEEQRMVEGYLAAYNEESSAADRLARFEAPIKEIIGDTDGITLPPDLGKRIDWKANAKGNTKWKDVAHELGGRLGYSAEAMEVEAQSFKGEAPRVLRPWFSKK